MAVSTSELLKAKAGRIDLVTVPQRLILAIDGEGRPPEGEFAAAIGALYPVAYTAKFDAKARGLEPPKLGALECVWDMDMAGGAWRWRLLIEQAPPLDARSVRRAIVAAAQKKPNPLFDRLLVERWREGRCAQTLHVGPYDQVSRTYDLLQEELADLALVPDGRFHEIYLSDPSRTAPEKLRTIVRVPVTNAA